MANLNKKSEKQISFGFFFLSWNKMMAKGVLFIYRQIDNLWHDTDPKNWYLPLFSSKKFGYSILKQYICTTRTRQASQRCSNVRVVFFYYGKVFKTYFSPAQLVSWITDPTCFYDTNTFTKTKQLIDAELAKSREDFIEHFSLI